ncbi:MAG: GNAT family N-acetyltransferase [Acidimicrobiales bacterium]
MLVAPSGQMLDGWERSLRAEIFAPRDALAEVRRSVTLRIIGVVEDFRHRGIGRRLVERIESEARILDVEHIGLGTDNAVGFWFHLGYTPNLLLQWAYDADAYEMESQSLLSGPLSGLRHWRSSFSGVPQLFVELDEPRLNLLATVRGQVIGCHVGFMMSNDLRRVGRLTPVIAESVEMAASRRLVSVLN